MRFSLGRGGRGLVRALHKSQMRRRIVNANGSEILFAVEKEKRKLFLHNL